jgi:hypothetical protein
MTKHRKSVIGVGVSVTDSAAGAGAPGIAIEITPKMIEAGVLAAREHCLGENLEEVVRDVFLAMVVESLG